MILLTRHGVVEPFALIQRERTLPRPGEVLKRPGQTVNALDVVARARVPQNHLIINIARQLRVPIERVDRYILKQAGDPVEEGEPIAARRIIAGLRRIMVRSPIEGAVVEAGGGRVILEGEPQIVEVKASMPGTIVESTPPWGVVVQAEGARVQLAWGHGKLAYSELKILTPDETGQPIPETLDDMEHRGTIAAIAAPLDEAFLRAAARTHVEGLVGASMDAGLVPLVEELGLNLGLSEGFGHVPMSGEVAQLLHTNAGRQLSLDPGSAGHWRFLRPEIIIPLPGDEMGTAKPQPQDPLLEVGQRVRLLRGPHRGAIGRIVALPEEPRQLPSGLWLVGAQVELKDRQVTFAPFANLEHLG